MNARRVKASSASKSESSANHQQSNRKGYCAVAGGTRQLVDLPLLTSSFLLHIGGSQRLPRVGVRHGYDYDRHSVDKVCRETRSQIARPPRCPLKAVQQGKRRNVIGTNCLWYWYRKNSHTMAYSEAYERHTLSWLRSTLRSGGQGRLGNLPMPQKAWLNEISDVPKQPATLMAAGWGENVRTCFMTAEFTSRATAGL